MKSNTLKIMVLSTVIALTLATFIAFKMDEEKLSPAIQVHTEGQPTIGYPKATVHVVIFEEPKCSDCKSYNNMVFPLIKKDFIDTNKILYTVIPVSFLPNSMPAAIAWLCVFNQEKDYPNKDLFFRYVDYMYKNQPPESEDWATDKTLQKFAREVSPAISLDQLKSCVDTEGYRIQIEKNTQYGSKIMNGELSTPTVYVDGVKLEDITYSNISKLIKSALKQKGVGG